MDDVRENVLSSGVRPLYHPRPDEITVQGVLYALSDPVRLRIFLQLTASDCTKNCTTFLNVVDEPLSKSTLSQHFKVLREAGLIHSERKGVELQNRPRCGEFEKPIAAMIGGILDAYKREQKRSAPKGRTRGR